MTAKWRRRTKTSAVDVNPTAREQHILGLLASRRASALVELRRSVRGQVRAVVVDAHGAWLELDDGDRFRWDPSAAHSLPQLARYGELDLALRRAIARIVTTGDTVIDVGAGFGYFTMLLSRLVGDTGWVHAFEPGPLADDLRANIAANERLNVLTSNCAVLDGERTVEMFDSAEFGPTRASVFGHYADAVRYRTVPAVSLDWYLAEHAIDDVARVCCTVG